MSVFIMGALAVLVVAFLIGISIQLIRIEKAIDKTVMIVEVLVKKQYEGR
jgi:hypothetical protein